MPTNCLRHMPLVTSAHDLRYRQSNVLWMFIVIAIILALPLKSKAENIVIVDDGYCPFMCDSEETPGIYYEILSEIWRDLDHQLQQEILPFKRAMHLAQTSNNQHDTIYIVIGTETHDQLKLTASDPISFHQVCFFTGANNAWRYSGPDSTAAKLGYIDGYTYHVVQDYLFREQNPNDLTVVVGDKPTLKLMRLVAANRLDGFADIRSHAETLLQQHKLDKAVINAGCVSTPHPIRVMLPSLHPKTPELLRSINEGIRKLRRNGKAQAIFKRYNMPIF